MIYTELDVALYLFHNALNTWEINVKPEIVGKQHGKPVNLEEILTKLCVQSSVNDGGSEKLFWV